MIVVWSLLSALAMRGNDAEVSFRTRLINAPRAKIKILFRFVPTSSFGITRKRRQTSSMISLNKSDIGGSSLI